VAALEQACDFLEDDLDWGYVRVLQEMVAAGWSNAGIGAAVRELLGFDREVLPIRSALRRVGVLIRQLEDGRARGAGMPVAL
jgi:hypothetical protein